MLKKFQKTTKYQMSIVVILALLFQVLIPSGSNVAFAAVKRDVIDSVEITNEQGETQDNFSPMDRIRIDVKWSIKSNVKAGDTFNFQLPSKLRGFNGIIYLNDDNGNNFGIGKGSGNSIVFKFSDNVEKYDNVSGFFYVQTEIKYIEQQGEVLVPLEFKVNGKVIYKKSIIVDTGTTTNEGPSEITEVFYKWGTIAPNDDTLINWALRINYKGDILYDTIVTDVLSDGHEFVDGSLSVYEGYTNYATGEIEPIVEKIEITGTKVWEGDSEEDRPDIELQLYRDGEAFGESITLESGKSEYTWTDLDKTDETGREYTYTVDEVEVPEGYKKSISEDGLTITNTYIIEEPVVEEPDEPEDEDSIIVEDDEIPMGEIEGPMDVLPKTGEGSRQIFYLSGLLLILIGIVSKRRV